MISNEELGKLRREREARRRSSADGDPPRPSPKKARTEPEPPGLVDLTRESDDSDDAAAGRWRSNATPPDAAPRPPDAAPRPPDAATRPPDATRATPRPQVVRDAAGVPGLVLVRDFWSARQCNLALEAIETGEHAWERRWVTRSSGALTQHYGPLVANFLKDRGPVKAWRVDKRGQRNPGPPWFVRDLLRDARALGLLGPTECAPETANSFCTRPRTRAVPAAAASAGRPRKIVGRPRSRRRESRRSAAVTEARRRRDFGPPGTRGHTQATTRTQTTRSRPILITAASSRRTS